MSDDPNQYTVDDYIDSALKEERLINTSYAKTIEQLQGENDTLAARVARLEQIAYDFVEYTGYRQDADTCRYVAQVLNESPAQSCAEIEAAAVDNFAQALCQKAKELPAQHEAPSRGQSTYNWQMHYVRVARCYASQLRQQGSD